MFSEKVPKKRVAEYLLKVNNLNINKQKTEMTVIEILNILMVSFIIALLMCAPRSASPNYLGMVIVMALTMTITTVGGLMYFRYEDSKNLDYEEQILKIYQEDMLDKKEVLLSDYYYFLIDTEGRENIKEFRQELQSKFDKLKINKLVAPEDFMLSHWKTKIAFKVFKHCFGSDLQPKLHKLNTEVNESNVVTE